MGINQLASTLQGEQASTGQIVIDSALCGKDISGFLTTNIYRSNIILQVASDGIGPVTGNQLTVVGTVAAGDQGFLHLDARQVRVTFVEPDEVADFYLEVNLGNYTDPNPWNFVTSYNYLAGSLVEYFPGNQQQLRLSTADFGPEFKTGLSFAAQVQFRGPFAQLTTITALMGHPLTQASLLAPITQVVNGIQMFAYSQPLQGSWDLTLLQVSSPELVFLIDSVPDQSSLGDTIYPVQYGLRMSTFLGSGGLTGLTATSFFDYEPLTPVLQLEIVPAAGTQMTIAQLGTLMGTSNWDDLFDGSIGSALAEALTTFGFLSWTAGFYGDGLVPQITNSYLVLGSTKPIVLVQDFLTLSYLQTTWLAISPSTGGPSTFGVAARLDMPNGIYFAVDVQYETTNGIVMSGILASDQPGNDSLTTWLNTFAAGFGLSPIPDNVAEVLDDFSLSLIEIDLGQNAQRTEFGLRVVGGMSITGQSVTFVLQMRFRYINNAWSYVIDCAATVGSALFKGTFASDTSETSFNLHWESPDNALGLDAIAETLGFELPPIPEYLDLNLVAANFEYNTTQNLFLLTGTSSNWGSAVLAAFQQQQNWVFAFNMAVQRQGQLSDLPLINLSNLPLVNQVLTGRETLGVDLQVIVTSAPLTVATTTLLNNHLPNLPQFPAEGFAGGWGFAIQFNFGGFLVPVSMGMQGENSAVQRNTPATSTVGATTPNAPAPVTPQQVASNDGAIWVNVQKTLGPVTFQKVGVLYEGERLWFLLNADLRMSGLTMQILGLRVGTPLDTFSPSFDIDGLGIDYKSAGFELGGALLNMRPATGTQFAGIAVAKAFGLSASLMGSYGQLQINGRDVTTMFLFGQLSGLAIGQPYLMLTAIAGGMGYNSSLRIPSAAAVGTFPFVAGLTDASKLGGANASPMDVLRSLMVGSNGQAPWVSTSVGQSWVAAGLAFSSFGYLTMSALGVVQFGNDLNVALLGMLTAQFPKTGSTWAAIQLNYAATYRSSEGALAFSAVLGSGSYLLSPSVAITGGLAMRSWSKGAHAGDYVITVGGYHPRFAVPAWYPAVNRVGISWSLGSTLSITGGAYLALMPGAMMLGGSLNVNFVDGNLRAWFNAGFDALIKYAPFAYDVNVGVTVGASYTVDKWYCTKTFTVELGCNLRVWGPPTGGKVIVDWWVLSFEINFGATAPRSTAATSLATWADFQPLLPPAGKYATIQATSGMLGSAKNAQGVESWAMSLEGFTVTTESAIPLSAATMGGGAVTKPAGTPAVNILPMGKTNLTSKQDVTLLKKDNNGTFGSWTMTNWTNTTLKRNLPKALWGTGSTNTLPSGSQLIANEWTGLMISSPVPTQNSSLPEFPAANLVAESPASALPLLLRPGSPAVGPVATESANAAHTIIANVNTPASQQQRQAIWQGLGGLGFELPTPSPQNQPNWSVESLFQAQPLIIPSTPNA